MISLDALIVTTALHAIAVRTIQGAGAAAVAPAALSLLSTAFGPDQRPRALGLFASITGLATLGGPLIGGAIVQNLAWQWIFWINVPIAAVLIPLVLGRLEKNAGSARGLDYAGIALVSAAAFGLVWGLIRGNESGWAGAEVVAALVGGAFALVVFIGWELRADTPLIPIRFFATRAFSAGNRDPQMTAARGSTAQLRVEPCGLSREVLAFGEVGR